MLILLPPSEGKTPARRGRPLDLSSLSFPSLTSRREIVISALEQVSGQPDASAVLGVSSSLVDQVRRNLDLRTAPTAAAVQVYSGVLYQALDHASLEGAAKRRANRSVVVISAVFGALRLTDRVPAYRVHVCARVPGVGALDRGWRSALSGALDAAVKPRELVVDCRSTTYAAMWRPTQQRAEAWVQVAVPARHTTRSTREGSSRASSSGPRHRAAPGAWPSACPIASTSSSRLRPGRAARGRSPCRSSRAGRRQTSAMRPRRLHGDRPRGPGGAGPARADLPHRHHGRRRDL